MSTPPAPRAETSVLRRLGAASWAWLGILGLAAVLVLALSVVAGLVVPFVVAVVVAVLLVPLVDVLQRRGLPRALGAVLVLLGFVGVLAGVVALSVGAVVSQWAVVTADLRSGIEALVEFLVARGVEIDSPRELLTQALALVGVLTAGPSSAVGGALSSLTAFLVGTFIAVFLLFLLLTDWHRLVSWVSSRLWVPAEVGAGLVGDAVDSLRRYYVALSLSSAVVSVVITVAAWLLDVPLALAIGVVTFVTSFVPYLGAIVSGAFAVLIALGATGPVQAVVLLLIVLVTQNVVQTIIQAKLTGAALELHPIVTFSATIVGAAVAGILGASLAVPLVAAVRRVVVRLRDWRETRDALPAAVAPPPAVAPPSVLPPPPAPRPADGSRPVS